MLTSKAHDDLLDEVNVPAPLPKTREYYSIVNNLTNTWNNPYRISRKFYRYYHESNARFEQTQPTDSQKLRSTMIEEEKRRQDMHRIGRELQREQLKTRKASREVLQFCSSQFLTKGADKELAQEVAHSENNIATEFTMQKTYKDPSKHAKLCPNCVYLYHEFSKGQLQKVIRPPSIRGDKEMCEHVARTLENDKLLDEYAKVKRDKKRQKLLHTLHRRHEINYELEQKAGIKKPLYLQENGKCRPQTTKNSLCGEFAPLKLGYVNPQEKQYVDTPLIMRLKNSKRRFEPRDLYLHGEFRGLLFPDHPTVIEDLETQKKSGKVESRPSTAAFSDRKSQIGQRKTMRNFPPPLHTATQSRPVSQGQPIVLLSARDTKKGFFAGAKLGEEGKVEDKDEIEKNKKLMMEHTQKFGKTKSKVGYSKAMLEDSMRYEKVVEKRLVLNKHLKKDSIDNL